MDVELSRSEASPDREADRAIGARLAAAMDGRISPVQAATIAECSPNTLRRWLKGDVAVDAKGLGRLATHLGVTVEWLLTGVPFEARDATTHVSSSVRSALGMPAWVDERKQSAVQSIAATNLGATVRIRVLDVQVSAGNGVVNGDHVDEERIDFPALWLRGENDVEHLSLLRVAGDSMEPDLRAGDWVLVDDRRREDAGIHVVRRGDHLSVKRLQRQGRKLRLISSNPLYETEEIDLSENDNDFDVVGKAIWSGRWF